jgi:nitroreductase
MDLFEAIEGRRSIRAFDGKPVARETLDRIIEAAGRAPSARNAQPWHFYVATGEARDRVGHVAALSTVHLQEYMDLLPADDLAHAEAFFASLGHAPVAIIVTIPVETEDHVQRNDYVATGCAIQNLMLAAYAEGLGCCNVSFPFWVRDELYEAIGIEHDREIVSLMVLGHPAETPKTLGRRSDIATFLD